jgi:enterochelin esterase-like enzyme
MKKIGLFGIVLMLVVGFLLAVCSNPTASDDNGEDEYVEYTQSQLDALEVTTVYRDYRSPTGYYVTFRYVDPDATRVRVKGEWVFTDLAHASLTNAANLGPKDWKDGMVVYSSLYWLYEDAELIDSEKGLWSYTIPLPAGHWPYSFVIGEGDTADWMNPPPMVYDPNNPPIVNGEPKTSEEFLSSIYVPIDVNKQQKTAAFFGDWSDLAPRQDQKTGQVFYKNPSDNGGDIPFGVYLPAGFDSVRAEKYPILVLYHGGGGTECSWVNLGGINHILDNLIAEGRLEPTIAVMPTTMPNGNLWDRPAILSDVLEKILPYMVQNYNAATDPNRRAFAGLSMGGATAAYAMFQKTDDFGYFGMFSAPLTEDVAPDYTLPALKNKGIFFGFGWWDFVCFRGLYSLFPDENGNLVSVVGAIAEGSIYEYLKNLGVNNVPYTSLELPTGHMWVMWRKSATTFMENVLWK